MSKLRFAKPRQSESSPQTRAHAYRVLIVDDEQDVHLLTTAILRDFTLDGRHLELLHAYSAREAKTQLLDNPDTALVLLDVVMEEEDSGLQLVRWIRGELANPFVRIVLRTGQPGQAPEEQVIVDYDINDYKEKTELTAKKLFTLLVSTLRAYRDLIELERNRNYVLNLLEATGLVLGTLDPEGRITDLTPSAEQLSWLQEKDVQGRFVWDLMATPDDARRLREEFFSRSKDPANARRPRLFQGHLQTQDSQNLVLWGNPVLSQGKSVGFAIVCEADISKHDR
jgi:CheY-like chemotaxis protein